MKKDKCNVDLLVRALNALQDAMPADLHQDLTLRQMGVLAAVGGSGGDGQSVKDLAPALGLDKPAISRHVSRLVKLKLVHKRRHEGDDRLVDISITPAGQRVLGDLSRALAKVMSQVRA